MKIKHLLEYKFPNIEYRKVKTDKHPVVHPTVFGSEFTSKMQQRNKDVEHLGSGTFSSAYTNPKTIPHDVRKVSKVQPLRAIDGFYFYIKGLEANSDNTNPYFPRFRDIKIYVDPGEDDDGKPLESEDNITYSVQMERLYSLKALQATEEEAILTRILGSTTDSESYQIANILTKKQWSRRPVEIIKALINDYDKLSEYIIDEDLLRAAAWLKELSKVTWLDLHDENLMFRRTSVGAQLVISDPFSYQR